MKVYISADMEGTGGVVHSNQTESSHPEYERARKLMIGEVNAAVEGALKGGAKTVLVNDSHAGMRNLLIEEMHPEAVLLSGSPKPYSMMSGLDAGFDAVFFTGYHARAGSSFGNLDHINTGLLFHSINQSFERLYELITVMNTSKIEWRRKLTLDLINRCIAKDAELFTTLHGLKNISEKEYADLHLYNKRVIEPFRSCLNSPDNTCEFDIAKMREGKEG